MITTTIVATSVSHDNVSFGMSIFFCVLSHGKPTLTIRCLNNLWSLGVRNLVVLDNGSSSQDRDILLGDLPSGVHYISHPTNIGITSGRVKMAHHSRSLGASRVVFLDNDQFPIREAISTYTDKPPGVIIGAEAWAMDANFRPTKMVVKEGEPFTYIGCGGMCVDISDWDMLGGFDEIFSPYYFEDPDFCLRALDAGFSLKPMRKSYITHEAHSTLSGKKDRMSVFLNNYIKFRGKWASRPDLLQRGVLSWA